jgi:hypothetical protein
MSNAADLEKARLAYERAWEEMKRCDVEMRKSIRTAQMLNLESSRTLFRRAAETAHMAANNWKSSITLANKAAQGTKSSPPSR